MGTYYDYESTSWGGWKKKEESDRKGKSCPSNTRHNPTCVYDKDGLEIWAGSKYQSEPYAFQFGYVLNCSGTRLKSKEHRIPFKWGGKYENVAIREIFLDWDNNEPPEIAPEFWGELVAELKSSKTSVLVCCMGGHGRTGTALASMLIADGWTATEAIHYIWDIYCKDAVETQSQVDYLKKLEESYVKKQNPMQKLPAS